MSVRTPTTYIQSISTKETLEGCVPSLSVSYEDHLHKTYSREDPHSHLAKVGIRTTRELPEIVQAARELVSYFRDIPPQTNLSREPNRNQKHNTTHSKSELRSVRRVFTRQ